MPPTMIGVGQSASAPPSPAETNLPTSASTQQQQVAAAGIDTLSELFKQVREADEQATAATKEAMTQVAGPHQLPGAARPLGPAAHPLYQYDTQPVYGHHNAQMRGIVNVSKGVSNLVAQVTQMETQKKTQRLAVNIERLMTATQSMDQAAQVLQTQPQNEAALAQKKKAQAIQDEILSDPKVRKDIEKAYNISFTDPSKNNTPEHAALKQATDSYSQQFQKQLPTQLQQDPQKVAAAQLAQAQAKATHDLVGKVAPALLGFQGKIGAAAIGAEAKTAAQQLHDKTMKEIAADKDLAYIKGQNIHMWAALGAARIREKAIEYDADKRLEGVKYKQDLKDPKTMNGIMNDFKAIQDGMLKQQQIIQNATQQRKLPGINDQQMGTYDTTIRIAENSLAGYAAMQKKMADKMADLAGLPKDQTTKTDAPNTPANQNSASSRFMKAMGSLGSSLFSGGMADAGTTGTNTGTPGANTSGAAIPATPTDTTSTSNESDTSAEDDRLIQQELASDDDSADDSGWIYQ